MKKKSLVAGMGVGVMLVVSIGTIGAVASATCEALEQEASVATDAHTDTQLYAPEYSWKEQQIAKIVGFESGYCCDICQHYVASACINRMNYWYDGDPIAMVKDGNDEYYYMNPDYAEYDVIEVNGWNYYEHCESALKIVKEAEKHTADIWYWDCDDTQRAWAELIYHCPEDGMWFYR